MSEGPEQLRTRLEVLEAEEEFHSNAPPDPQRFRWWEMVIVVVCAVGLIYGVLTYDLLLVTALVLVLGLVFMSRLCLKNSYEIYSQACKLIHYYKLLDQSSGDAHKN